MGGLPGRWVARSVPKEADREPCKRKRIESILSDQGNERSRERTVSLQQHVSYV